MVRWRGSESSAGDAADGAVLSRRRALVAAAAGVGGAATLGVLRAAPAAAVESGVLGVSMFLPETYGAVGDGVADDAVAIQAAIDAAAAVGGGIVVLQEIYGWSGALTVKNGVYLTANSGNARFIEGGEPPHLVALDTTSQVKLGDWGTGQDRPGGLIRIRISGNGTGPDDGLVRIEGAGIHCESVHVSESANGPAWYLDGANNCTFISCDSFENEGGVWKLARGASNNGWFRCQTHTNRWACWITGEPTDETFPSNNSFLSCLFENAQIDIDQVIRIDCGIGNKFACMDIVSPSSGFVNHNDAIVFVTSDPDLPPAEVEIESCHFAGAQSQPSGVRVQGDGHVVTISGDTWMNNTPTCIVADGGTSTVQLIGNVYGGGENNLFGTINGGSTELWRIDRSMGYAFAIPDTIPANVLTTKPAGGGLPRFELDRDGLHRWRGSNGTSTLTYDGDARTLVATGGLMVAGRTGRTFEDIQVKSPGAVVTLDADAFSAYAISLVNRGTVGAMTVTGGAVGTRLMVQVSATDALQLLEWAPTMRFDEDVAPAPRPGHWLTLDFVRQGNLWLEISRTVSPSS